MSQASPPSCVSSACSGAAIGAAGAASVCGLTSSDASQASPSSSSPSLANHASAGSCPFQGRGRHVTRSVLACSRVRILLQARSGRPSREWRPRQHQCCWALVPGATSSWAARKPWSRHKERMRLLGRRPNTRCDTCRGRSVSSTGDRGTRGSSAKAGAAQRDRGVALIQKGKNQMRLISARSGSPYQGCSGNRVSRSSRGRRGSRGA